MGKKIRTALLAALLSILFCMGVSAADYTIKAGSQGLKVGSSLHDANKEGSLTLSVKEGSEQAAGLASVKDQENQQASVSSRNDIIQADGTVIELLPNAVFRVELQNGQQIPCYLSGKLRMYFIRIHIGDKVMIDMPSSDQSKGRVIWRYK